MERKGLFKSKERSTLITDTECIPAAAGASINTGCARRHKKASTLHSQLARCEFVTGRHYDLIFASFFVFYEANECALVETPIIALSLLDMDNTNICPFHLISAF